MKILISLFLSISINLYGAEVQNVQPLKDFDQHMVILTHKTNHYLKQLEGAQGCRLSKGVHAIFQTEIRKWCKAREKVINSLLVLIKNPTLTSRNKMAAIDIIITSMEETWQNFEKTQPPKSYNLCKVAPQEEVMFFDGFADYYHSTCKEIFAQINLLFEADSKAFPEMVCIICLEKQPEVIYSCKHFVLCFECSTKVGSCPNCRTHLIGKKKPIFFARCKGCSKETVDTICGNCDTMELCQDCSQKQHSDGSLVNSCSSFFCKFRERRIEKCFTSCHE